MRSRIAGGGDVVLGHVQPEDLVPGERRLQLAAKLALMAGDDDAHGFVLPDESTLVIHHGDTENTETIEKTKNSVFSVPPWFISVLLRTQVGYRPNMRAQLALNIGQSWVFHLDAARGRGDQRYETHFAQEFPRQPARGLLDQP